MKNNIIGIQMSNHPWDIQILRMSLIVSDFTSGQGIEVKLACWEKPWAISLFFISSNDGSRFFIEVGVVKNQVLFLSKTRNSESMPTFEMGISKASMADLDKENMTPW